MPLKIRYYGVRGSLPVSGSEFDHFGGDTTCVLIEQGDTQIIIDAGTGIRKLGMDLMKTEIGSVGGRLHLFFTHTHWDHIQGFPFFIPAFLPKNTIEIYGETKVVKTDTGDEIWDIERILRMQQHFIYFPIDTKYMASNKIFHPIESSEQFIISGMKIDTMRLEHPNSTVGFRFEHNGKKYCYCTDLEHSATMVKKITEFAKGVDVLAYDCQYTPEEYLNGKISWGHSTYEVACEIANAAGVRELHMIHHDPLHTDERLFAIEKDAQKLFKKARMIPEDYSFSI